MMEKGSFHPSRNLSQSATTTQVSEADEWIRNIPLPNQLPKGIDFNDIPAAALKSSTLESLIQQNEDLLARLNVVLRKSSEMEDQVARLEQENKGLRSRFETLKEQYQILQEKDRISVNRALQIQDEARTFKSQAEKLEKLYADVYVQAQAFQKQMARLERYRVRIINARRPIQQRAKQFARLNEELESLRGQQAQIVHGYEAKLADIRQQLTRLTAKAMDRDAVFEDKVQIENQLVLERRQFEQSRMEAEARVDQLAQDNASLRQQLKDSLVAQETQKQELERLNGEIPHLTTAKQNLIEQVESLQSLWTHKQKELEALEEKNKALQKLNQNISVTLNQQRKDMHQLHTELDKERFTSEEKIKTLLAKVQMLRRQLLEG